MRERLLAAAAIAVLSVSIVRAEPSPSPEAQALIEKQLDAFSRDDAAGAYAEASPEIQSVFPDPDAFMAMVRRGYAPVYRHRSVEFGPAAVEADTIRQEATFVDGQGKVWKAMYRLSRGPNGWRISACWLLEDGASA